MFPEELSPGEIVDDDSFDDPKKHEVASPGSSLSFSPSSRTAGGTGSALGTLMAEMDDEEDEDDILSPLPCTATPPTFHHSQQEEKRENHANSLKSDMSPPGGAGGTHKGKHRRSSSSTTGKPEKKSSAKTEKKSKEPAKKDGGDLVGGGGGVVEKTDHKSLSSGTSGCVEENPCDLKGHKAPNGEHLSVLLELQKKLVTMQDRGLLQQVVNVIEETGLYKIGDSTFDFDLCMLDSPTVQKLKAFLDSAT